MQLVTVDRIRPIVALPPLGAQFRKRGGFSTRRTSRRLYELLAFVVPPLAQIPSPIFVVGCQRSGKTTFARILGTHPNPKIARQFRQFLVQAYPVADVESKVGDSRAQQTRLVLSAQDVDPSAAARLKRLLWSGMRAEAVQRLVADNWSNSFRLSFLHALFPDAKFLHVIRHGAEVALAVEAMCLQGRMWMARPHIWKRLENYARQSERYARLLPLCDSPYTRGLLAWKMILERIRADASSLLTPRQYYEVRYEDLLRFPARTCEQIARFVGQQYDSAMLARASEQVHGRPLPLGSYPSVTAALAGDLLDQLGYS